MTEDEVVGLVRYVIYTGTMVAGPLVLLGLVVGVVMGVLQSATQIQEAALSFVPKLVALGMGLVLGGHWLLEQMTSFTGRMILEIARMGPQGRG